MIIDQTLVCDPLVMELPLLDKKFESVFNSLEGVYLRLYYQESQCPGDGEATKPNFFFLKFKEIVGLKNACRYRNGTYNSAELYNYTQELIKMLNLELTKYSTAY